MRYGTLTRSILFQSTLSVRRATRSYGHEQFYILISIHALREESDMLPRDILSMPLDFNPRSP